MGLGRGRLVDLNCSERLSARSIFGARKMSSNDSLDFCFRFWLVEHLSTTPLLFSRARWHLVFSLAALHSIAHRENLQVADAPPAARHAFLTLT